MSEESRSPRSPGWQSLKNRLGEAGLRPLTRFAFTLLAIEFLDELIFGTREAAWPLIRTEFRLSYAQIGLLLSLPNIIGSLIEPVIGSLGDVGKRRSLVLGGGVVFALALFLTALSQDFFILLLSFILFSPASGSFVSLSQAALMDSDPARHEQNMARWTLAGSLGVVAGPLALSGAAALVLGWRGLFLFFGALALGLVAVARRFPFSSGQEASESASFLAGVREALGALRRREVLRWLTLLEFSDMMLDILLGFLALYMVDVGKVTPAQAGIAVAIWTGLGLLGDLLLIPLLERVRGLDYLRWSALLELVLFVAFLSIPTIWAKCVLLGLLGFFNSGWYSILKAQLYSAMPGQSGTVMAVGNVFGFVGQFIPLGLGLLAELVGLSVAMWLLLLGPVALLVGIPKRENIAGSTK
jgi:FSR family fosmidomycin resistance protein-like MFS transporter